MQIAAKTRQSTSIATKVFVITSMVGSVFCSAAQADPFGTVIERGNASKIYDISSTGAVSNGRAISYQNQTNIYWAGLARSGLQGAFYGLTQAVSGTSYPDHLFDISSSGGSSTVGAMGLTGHYFLEGDCARDPSTGSVWGLDENGDLYTFNLTANNPVATLVATIQASGTHDFSAMDFTNSGDLYALDLNAGGVLYKVNKTNGAILASISVGAQIAAGDAGMSFAPTGALYVIAPVFGGSAVSQRLFTLNPTTGAVTDSHVVTGPAGSLTGFVANGVVSGGGGGGGVPVASGWGLGLLMLSILGIGIFMASKGSGTHASPVRK